ncbi:MAG: GlsB/YeaQ/YmgE family stress response membrane protein [Chloroflexi bacterium]|nr:GlsB/YeaQ/YmgE family stress response membrane protein [Chloroflexota bacterium]
MLLVLVSVVLLILFGTAFLIWATFGLIALGLHLLMAGLVGALADAAVPGRLPWGWLGAVLAGLVGSWVGTWLIGDVGPALFGVPLLPAFTGAVILALVLSVVARLSAARQ